MFVFIPEYGTKGIWVSIFNSVSAFCNAGIDIVGENSLCNFATNPLINGVTCSLIILGGLGYIVWWDVIRVIKTRTRKNKKVFRHLTLHSKIAITFTIGLILVGAICVFIFEYSNPLTLGNKSLFDKIQMSIFQSVTTRTAGFATMPQENLTNATVFVSMFLMLIGGSPVGTAGGIKTVTLAVLFSSALSSIRNKNKTTMFGRCISEGTIKKAVAVLITFVSIWAISTLLLLATIDAPAIDLIYESVSATATVGLSRNLTATLNTFGKIVIIFSMYFGRVGPISLAVAIGKGKESQNVVLEPYEEISIG